MATKQRPKSDPANIGRTVHYWGQDWKIIGVNYVGSYSVERYEDREDGRYRIKSSCILTLPKDHPHYAFLKDQSNDQR